MGVVWRALGCFLGAAAAFWPRTVWANPPAVRLTVEHCQSLDPRAIQRIFSADLGTTPTNKPGPEVTEVSITCEGEHVAVRVLDPISRKTLRRSFDPRSFGTQAQSRIVAIAASELVLASWAELDANPMPQVPPEGPAPSPAALEVARAAVRKRQRPSDGTAPAPAPEGDSEPSTAEPPATPAAAAAQRGGVRTMDAATLDTATPRSPSRAEQPPEDGYLVAGRAGPIREKSLPIVDDRLTAVVSFRSLLRGDGTFWGGGVRFGRERYRVVSYAVDALVENGTLKESNAMSASAGAWLCFYKHLGPATFRLGGGLRLGVLGFAGGSSAAVWGWPMLVGSQTLRFGGFVIELAGETGFVNATNRHGQPPIRGGWASGQVGIGMAL